MTTTKRCPSCEEIKPRSEFHRNRRQKDGHSVQCKACMREWLRDFRARNPEKCKLYRSRQWSHQKQQKLFYKYRVTKEEQEARMAEQGGKCAICGDLPDKKPLQLDHDHESGKMRGWLCFRCNRGLGMFRDNPDAIERAAEYLRHAKGVSEVA